MPESFRRYLTDPAFAALLPLRAAIESWSSLPGACVELRRNDTTTFYRWGRRVVELSGEATPSSPEALQSMLSSRGDDMRRDRSERSAVAVLADLCPQSGWLVVDREVAIPRAALADLDLTLHRVDLLLLDSETGVLWLVEVKLADSEELDGDVLDQLRLTAALPRALRGGEDELRAHYRRLMAQKAKLGLLPGDLVVSDSPVRTACFVVGGHREAWARIACWDDPAGLDQVGLGIFARDETPPPAAALMELPAAALQARDPQTDRSPYAPRRSRHTKFAAAEDARQKAWRKAHPTAPHLGPLSDWLLEYLASHDADPHPHLNHLRSSQALCLQLFAPVAREPGGADARRLLELLSTRLDGFQPGAIEAVHFEAPHGRRCLDQGCPCAGDARLLVGEKGSKWTRLDVLLLLQGRRGSRSTRACLGLEVKYTEPEFGSCGGFTSDGNDDDGKWTCLDRAKPRQERCYLRRIGRSYLEDRAMFREDPLKTGMPCPLLGPLNQLYRGHFLTRELGRHLGCDESFYGVLYHGGNPDLLLPERAVPGLSKIGGSALERYAGLLVPEARREFLVLTVEEMVAGLGSADWVGELGERYGVVPP